MKGCAVAEAAGGGRMLESAAGMRRWQAIREGSVKARPHRSPRAALGDSAVEIGGNLLELHQRISASWTGVRPVTRIQPARHPLGPLPLLSAKNHLAARTLTSSPALFILSQRLPSFVCTASRYYTLLSNPHSFVSLCAPKSHTGSLFSARRGPNVT